MFLTVSNSIVSESKCKGLSEFPDHTRGEDLYMFPEIEKAANEKGLMDFNKEEHGRSPHLFCHS